MAGLRDIAVPRAVRAEWRRTTTLPAIPVSALAAVAAGWVLGRLAAVSADRGPALAPLLDGALPWLQVAVALVAVLVAADDDHDRAVGAALLARPRRWGLLAARAVGAGAGALACGTAALASLALGASIPLRADDAPTWIAAVAALVAAAALAAALALACRSTTWPFAAFAAWTLAIAPVLERVLGPTPWLPTRAVHVLLADESTTLVTVLALGAPVLLAVAAAAVRTRASEY